MHFTICVPFIPSKQDGEVKEKIEKLISNFDLNKKVEPFKKYLTKDEIEKISKYYNITSSQQKQIAEKINDWNGNEGGIDQDRIYQISTNNPNGLFDYWSVYEVLRAEDIINNNQVFQGIITPEGKLIESKKLFLSVNESNVADWNLWKEEFHKCLEKYKDDFLVALIDCHR